MTINQQAEVWQPNDSNVPIKALLLDDDAYDRRRIQRFTERSDLSLQISEVASIKAMAEAVSKEDFDLLMIDYQLNEGSGLDAVDLIKANVAFENTPIIMISGNQKSSVAVSAFRQGCHDFVAKDDLSPVVLQQAVLGALQASHNTRLQQHTFAADLRYQVQLALRETLQNGEIQAAITDGMRSAAKATGFEAGARYSQEMQNFFSDYLAEDEFAFKQ